MQNNDNRSIFKYMTDQSMFINNNECIDTTTIFLCYINVGTPKQNIDIENDLRGSTRNNTRCTSCKWKSPNPNLAEQISTTPVDVYPNNNKLCTDKIIRNGFIQK